MNASIMLLRTIMTTPISGGKGQYKYIDLLRGIASIVILVVHYRHFFQGTDQTYNVSDIALVQNFEYWQPIYSWGSNAVQLFWLISGFIFLHVYGSQKKQTWKKFITSRAARLYPLHLLTLLFVAIIQTYTLYKFGDYNIYQYNDVYHFILNLFFASEWGLQEGRSFNGPIWSVSVEIFSYLIFFTLLKYITFSFTTIISCILISMLIYFAVPNLAVLCLIYFFSGCFFYGVIQTLKRFSKRKLLMGYLSAFIVVVYFVFIAPNNFPKIILYIPLFGLLVSLLAHIETEYKNLPLRHFTWIGNTSYGNYLWHSPLQMLFLVGVSLNLFNINIIFTPYFILIYVAFVILTSVVSFKIFEIPAQRYIKSLSNNGNTLTTKVTKS
jgi:peptidoglycan/LPS O-acetylase OafA/YrhL